MLRGKVVKRKIIIPLGLIVLFFSLIFIYTKKSTMLSVKRSTAAIKSSQILPRATNFAQYNTLRSSKLNTLNRKILGQEYIGAYVVSKNNNVVNSMGTGYANASEKQPFNYNSTVRVGNLESEINAILLMKTLKDSKISLSTRLNKYVPELDDKISINANQLLKMNLNISVDSKKLIGLNEKNATEKYSRIVKSSATYLTHP
ncbi:beta-lactamase [Lactiplantibacillus plantarum]|nr:beta-lactamase [Lactiplantibacillus plantarum]